MEQDVIDSALKHIKLNKAFVEKITALITENVKKGLSPFDGIDAKDVKAYHNKSNSKFLVVWNDSGKPRYFADEDEALDYISDEISMDEIRSAAVLNMDGKILHEIRQPYEGVRIDIGEDANLADQLNEILEDYGLNSEIIRKMIEAWLTANPER